MLNQSRLREVLFYNVQERQFTWIAKIAKHRPGDRAGTYQPHYGQRRITLDHHHYSEQSLALFYLSGIHPDEPFVQSVYEAAHTNYVPPPDDLGSIIEGIVSSGGVSYLDAIQLHLSRHPELEMDQIAIAVQVNLELFKKLEDEARQARNLKPDTPSPGSIICPHCGATGNSPSTMGRWHFNRCPRKPTEAHGQASIDAP